MATVYVVTSKVKALAKKKHEMRTSLDFIAELSKRVEEMVANAGEIAKTNKRKTIQAEDLV